MKPRIRKVPSCLSNGEWWICSCEQTYGFGRTMREAFFQWFAWKHLGIYS
jgi:hypothetical protein